MTGNKDQYGKIDLPEGAGEYVITLDGFREQLAGLIRRQVVAVRMTVTPGMANVMMERNASDEWSNRHRTKQNVDRITRAMSDGRWMYTGEPLIFSVSGNLLNGQHRLIAIIRSGAPADILVVFGVEDAAFKYMDAGTKRGASHVFEIEGVKNYAFHASVCKILNGYYSSSEWRGSALEADSDELLELFYSKPSIRSCHPNSSSLRTSGLITPRWAGALAHLLYQSDPERAEAFIGKVATGIGITSKDDPAVPIRNKLINELSKKHDSVSDTVKAAYIIQAWNYAVDGKRRTTFRWKSDQLGGIKEPFPRVK